MNVCDVIEAKKRKKILTEEQINCFVRAVADGSASDAQIAAFCMAVLLNGMTDKESALLTFAMQKSGRAVPRPRFPGVCADKHSTGGVSDSTTLVLVPVLASLGVRCAKYSGRGLGHTGGTLDKLESSPACAQTSRPNSSRRRWSASARQSPGRRAKSFPRISGCTPCATSPPP